MIDNDVEMNAQFDDFIAAGEVEVSEPVTLKTADDAPDDVPDDAPDDAPDDVEEPPARPKQKASERIRELNRRLKQSERLRLADADRLEALQLATQNQRLQKQTNTDKGVNEIGNAPDSFDSDKYPLGSLDDRYIEDKLEWLAERKAIERADAVLHRQQEAEQAQIIQQQQQALLDKVDVLSAKGDGFPDFQETVVEAGMRGEWRLEQPTFEAACEAVNGARIMYDLAQDKKEAARVAGLSAYAQLKYVMQKDAEIAGTSQARKVPKAGQPVATQTRGATSRVQIEPWTDNLDDFEKAWEADYKKK